MDGTPGRQRIMRTVTSYRVLEDSQSQDGVPSESHLGLRRDVKVGHHGSARDAGPHMLYESSHHWCHLFLSFDWNPGTFIFMSQPGAQALKLHLCVGCQAGLDPLLL
jgi:hypothetical protein